MQQVAPSRRPSRWSAWVPWSAAIVCLAALAWWWTLGPPRAEAPRTPVAWDRRVGAPGEGAAGDVETVAGPGKPAPLTGRWPQFRGPNRDNIARVERPLPRAWPDGAPRVLWRLAVGEGFAGAAIDAGRVFLIDYDRERQRDVIRCLSLDDGQEIWQTSYPVVIKRNHGMTRTIPAVGGGYVVTLGPRCHVYCCDAQTGHVVWSMDLKRQFGTVEPPWYAGQCPLIDGERVILAPGGKPLMMAVELATGRIVWQTPTHENLGMTHSSIMPAVLGGVRQYVYCTLQGVVGVDAETGRVLWHDPAWKISMATIPSPVPVGEDRLFLTGGYGAGSKMIRIVRDGDAFRVEELFRLRPNEFAAEQQTPVLWNDHLFAIIPPSTAGELACLTLDGRRLWTSGGEARFGLGPFLIASDGSLLALTDQTGTLVLIDADPAGYRERARVKVLDGHEAWAPMALADGRLIVRDLTEMVCLEIGPADHEN